MPRDRFVAPETTRLPLSDGDWVKIKSRLGVAEQKRLDSSPLRANTAAIKDPQNIRPADVDISMDLGHTYMEKLRLYILDWSFVDREGKPVEVSDQAIDALDPDDADEITAAIDAHIAEQKRLRATNPTTRSSSEQKSA